MPVAETELEIRSELRAGDLLFNNEIILVPFELDIFHSQTAAATDTEAFSLSPLASAAGGGVAIAQTSDRTIVATQTGFFHAFAPNFRIIDLPGEYIGQGLAWAGNAEPLRIAGLPQNTAMIFPAMTKVTRIDNQTARTNSSSNVIDNWTDRGNNNSYIIDNNFSKPYYPGNMMVVKNVTDERGVNETVIEPAPRDYMLLIATPAQIANRTIMERMWRNVHLNFHLDQAYSGETCFPDLICPLKSPFSLMYFYPHNQSNRDALILTRPGEHFKKLFWKV